MATPVACAATRPTTGGGIRAPGGAALTPVTKRKLDDALRMLDAAVADDADAALERDRPFYDRLASFS
ncbi:hypothetical protein HK405_014431, partial [Cladochytrium tenue]